VAGRFEWSELIPYWIAQLVGGFVAAVVLYAIASGAPDWTPGGFASNGYGARSPGGYSMASAFICEAVLTAVFLVVILGATARGAPVGFAAIAIGLALTMIHLVSIPVTNTSVNPARSTAVAFFADNGAVPQLWLFWAAPLLGAAIGGLIWEHLLDND
jgi:aquaporin Z